MPTFLFWNLQKKPLLPRVERLVRVHAVDVLILAECAESAGRVAAQLGNGWHVPANPNLRFAVLLRDDELGLTSVFDDLSERLSIKRLTKAGELPLQLALVHLLAWNNRVESDLSSVAQRLAGLLREKEQSEGLTRTVLVGDFNLSPFDAAMVSGEIFHGLMTRRLAARHDGRTIQGEKRRTFYNPMWQFLTDRDDRPAGTYYRRASEPLNHFWYAYDQVLVRPELEDKLRDVDILETDGTESLLTGQGWPDAKSGSDHLPLLFRLDW